MSKKYEGALSQFIGLDFGRVSSLRGLPNRCGLSPRAQGDLEMQIKPYSLDYFLRFLGQNPENLRDYQQILILDSTSERPMFQFIHKDDLNVIIETPAETAKIVSMAFFKGDNVGRLTVDGDIIDTLAAKILASINRRRINFKDTAAVAYSFIGNRSNGNPNHWIMLQDGETAYRVPTNPLHNVTEIQIVRTPDGQYMLNKLAFDGKNKGYVYQMDNADIFLRTRTDYTPNWVPVPFYIDEDDDVNVNGLATFLTPKGMPVILAATNKGVLIKTDDHVVVVKGTRDDEVRNLAMTWDKVNPTAFYMTKGGVYYTDPTTEEIKATPFNLPETFKGFHNDEYQIAVTSKALYMGTLNGDEVHAIPLS